MGGAILQLIVFIINRGNLSQKMFMLWKLRKTIQMRTRKGLAIAIQPLWLAFGRFTKVDEAMLKLYCG